MLVACSSAEIRHAYGTCAFEHPQVAFVPEADFRSDLLPLLPREGLVAFHCDDDLFYRDFAYPPIWGERWAPTLCAYSLRLGQNTTERYLPAQDGQVVPPTNPWRWPEADGDFGYPFSLDGHIYDAARIRALVSLLSFSSPNELEAALDGFARRRPADAGELLACPARSCVVSVPANRVQESFGNRHAGRPEWSAPALLARYQDGERLDLEATLAGLEIGAAHQELELRFRPC